MSIQFIPPAVPFKQQKPFQALGEHFMIQLFLSICSGDSGGPLTVEQRMSEDDMGPIRRELVGVVSAVGAVGCSRNVPDKYTAVTKYLKWI